MASIQGFHHTAVRSAVFDASIRFYTEGLGLKVKLTWGEAPKRAALIETGDGNYVEIHERTEPASESESAIVHFALRTDDCTALTEKARSAGAQITMEPKEVLIEASTGPVPVKISFFKGPAGEVVEFFENSLL